MSTSNLQRVAFISPAAGLGGAERCLIDFVAAIRSELPHATLLVVSLAEGAIGNAYPPSGGVDRLCHV